MSHVRAVCYTRQLFEDIANPNAEVKVRFEMFQSATPGQTLTSGGEFPLDKGKSPNVLTRSSQSRGLFLSKSGE